MKETLLYFANDDDERAVYPARNFLGIDLIDNLSMQVSFKKEDGTLNAAIVDLQILPGTNTGQKEVAEALAGALAGNSGGLTIVADDDNGVYLHPNIVAVTSIA